MSPIRWALLPAILAPGPALAQSVSVLHSFEPSDGIYPLQITLDHGIIYGTTSTLGPGNSAGYCNRNNSAGSGCGTVYTLDGAGHLTVLLAFSGANGSGPSSALIIKSRVMYGATEGGGDIHDAQGGGGVVFSVKTNGKDYHRLHVFEDNTQGYDPHRQYRLGLQQHDLRDHSRWRLWQRGIALQPGRDGTYTVLHNFPDEPDGVLMDASGNIFGVDSAVQTGDCGTLYEFQPATGAFSILVNFGRKLGCYSPTLAGIDRQGNFFGYALGGDHKAGQWRSTLFRIGAAVTGYPLTTLWQGTDVFVSGLTITGPNALFGETQAQGSGSLNSLFRFGNNAFRTLYVFADPTVGADPTGAPVQMPDGTMIGNALYGGACAAFSSAGCGTVFSYTP